MIFLESPQEASEVVDHFIGVAEFQLQDLLYCRTRPKGEGHIHLIRATILDGMRRSTASRGASRKLVGRHRLQGFNSDTPLARYRFIYLLTARLVTSICALCLLSFWLRRMVLRMHYRSAAR